MLERTFQLAPMVGPWRERDLWARGIARWSEFPAEGVVLSPRWDPPLREKLAEARAALSRRDVAALAALIPQREHWRLYPTFSDSVVFFDIEADSASPPHPTVVGLFYSEGGRERLEVFVAGQNLDALPETLARFPVWCTFNGRCFDVPVLRQHFGPTFPAPAVHLDLRVILRKLRLTGGLKAIEDELGVGRPPHLRGMNGLHAVSLWEELQRTGARAALRSLVEYNLYDALQLRSLMELGFNRLCDEAHFPEDRVPVFERGQSLFDLSRLLDELDSRGVLAGGQRVSGTGL